MSENAKTVLAELQSIRTREDLTLKPTKYLKETFTGFDGEEHPLVIRYYQIQGIMHLYAMKRFLLGDDTGLGKTLEIIGALAYLWDDNENLKVIVLTTKSAVTQWVNEFDKFTTGINAFSCIGTPKKREKARQRFTDSTGPTVMVMGYATAKQDISALQNWHGYALVADEATAFKNPKTKTFSVVRHMAKNSQRMWGLTATVIKNHLMEAYAIFSVVVPPLFDQFKSSNEFMIYYCLVETIVTGQGHRIPRVTGYLPSRLQEFKELIDPFFLGRAKHEVADELPVLSVKTIEIPLSKLAEAKYREALEGLDGGDEALSELIVGTLSGEEEIREVTPLTSITYCQLIADHPLLLDCEGESTKLKYLLDLLDGGELQGEKIIIFSRFKKMINIIMASLRKRKIKAVRVTGDENEQQREDAKSAFQDPKSDVRVVCITMAGSDAINLQAAKALVFFDSPWSAGDYLQILGRMIRIGSIHDRCYAIHLVALLKSGKRSKKTVDHRIMETLDKKMKVIEAVIGKRLKGDDDDDTVGGVISVESDAKAIFKALRSDAADHVKSTGKKPKRGRIKETYDELYGNPIPPTPFPGNTPQLDSPKPLEGEGGVFRDKKLTSFLEDLF